MEPDFETEFGSAKTAIGGEIKEPPITPAFEAPLRETRLETNDMYMLKKDIEIISSKLDALKAGIESINQRLMNIERIAIAEQQPQERRREW